MVSLAWADVIGADGEIATLDADLLRDGWRRAKAVRAYRTLTNGFTFCFVWRFERDGIKQKHSVTYRGVRPASAGAEAQP